jgi:hypothetical protein
MACALGVTCNTLFTLGHLHRLTTEELTINNDESACWDVNLRSLILLKQDSLSYAPQNRPTPFLCNSAHVPFSHFQVNQSLLA